jgi:hypothetical protein
MGVFLTVSFRFDDDRRQHFRKSVTHRGYNA